MGHPVLFFSFGVRDATWPTVSNLLALLGEVGRAATKPPTLLRSAGWGTRFCFFRHGEGYDVAYRFEFAGSFEVGLVELLPNLPPC